MSDSFFVRAQWRPGPACGDSSCIRSVSVFMLMDEPFASLDMQTRDSCIGGWRVWRDEKMTVILVTPYLDEAILLSDRIIVLRGGARIEEFYVNLPRPRGPAMVFEPGFSCVEAQDSRVLGGFPIK